MFTVSKVEHDFYQEKEINLLKVESYTKNHASDPVFCFIQVNLTVFSF